MSLSIVMAFWAVSFLFVITPRVDWSYAISAGIRGKVVMPAVGGMLLGHLAVTALVAAGLGALLASIPLALTALTMMGAAYLLWLGVNLLRHPAAPASAVVEPSDRALQWLLKGVGISSLNPKVFLLFLALLPQFADPESAWPLSVQMLVLGTIHILSCGAVYLVVGYGAQLVLKARPTAARWVSRVSGVAMMGIALALLAEPLLPKS